LISQAKKHIGEIKEISNRERQGEGNTALKGKTPFHLR